MQLEQLNDDCLESVFEYLNLEQQLTLALVSTRVRDVVKCIWRRKYRTQKQLTFSVAYHDSAGSVSFNTTERALLEFASAVCEFPEELIINDAEMLKLLSTQKWPNLKSLKSNIYYDAHESLNPTEFFAQFPALESLDLTWGVKFHDASYRESLRASLRSKIKISRNLAEVCLDVEDIATEVSYQIMKSDYSLKRVRMVPYPYHSGYPSDAMDYVKGLRRYADRLQTIVTKKCDIVKAIKYSNLRELVIIGFDVRDLDLESMPLLEKLHFRNPRFERSTFDVKACKKFFAYAAVCVEKQVREQTRHKPLKVYCDAHDDLWFMLDLSDHPEMLRVIFVHPPVYDECMLPYYLNMPWENVSIDT